MFLVSAWLALSAAQAQTTNYALGTFTLLEGPAEGSDSVLLAVTPGTGTWTATANSNWLHLNQSGIGSMNVIFSYDANSGATRSGEISIAGLTVIVTQAGATYVPVSTPTTVVGGLNQPQGVAVDGVGNVYIADTYNNAIEKWTAADNTLTTLVSSGLAEPQGVAVDSAGNVYIANTFIDAIQVWSPATSNVTTLLNSGLNDPVGVAVDGAGDVYIANTGNGEIMEWKATDRNVTILVSGIEYPAGVAVDLTSNVYFTAGILYEWTAANAMVTGTGATLILYPLGVAVDGSGNIYTARSAVEEWVAANNTISTLGAAEVVNAFDVAVDANNNVYIADAGNDAIEELPHAFLDPTFKVENATAGSDSLPAVLPVTANLLPPFAPISDQPWLTITGLTNGVVTFAFAANNTGLGRVAHITLLGQAIPIIQVFLSSPPVLTALPMQTSGVFQFAFADTQNSTFTVLSTSNLSSPLSNWAVTGTASNIAPNLFQFTDTNPATDLQRYYYLRSP
ncbi:MAG TPA: BACON domain-containing carbohydrate-binding protein [Verrucomicrobiae bacterium]|nr:BACON domain-containing carbohydrate-binding protein [Verrucomicrobiae bacterium]